MTNEPSPTAPQSVAGGRLYAVAGLVLCLAALTLVDIYDVDFGFHLAIGRHLLSEGIPAREFLAPAIADQPFAPMFLLGSLLMTLAWSVGGPAGLVLLKAVCYSAGFLLAARAATARGVPLIMSVLVAGLMACAASPRFVERPGMFSAMFLGLVLLTLSAPILAKGTLWLRAVAIPAGLFALWPFFHAEWMIGLLVYTLLLTARCRQSPETHVGFRWWLPPANAAGVGIAVPMVLFALIHPSGIRPLFAPVLAALGAHSAIPISEFQAAVWTQQWVAIPGMVAVAATAIWLFRNRRFEEAILLIILLAAALRMPRMVLPLLLVGVPAVAEAAHNLLKGKWFSRFATTPVGAVAVCVVLALAGVATTRADASRRFGLGLDPTLDTRGIGELLDRVPTHEGPILAGLGYSSLLLSNPSAVRQGIVMDGRIESYPPGYFGNVYTPSFVPGAQWEAHLASLGVAFYFEEFGSGDSLAGEFERLGWRMVGWDNSGRLFARGDVAERHGLPELRFDPARLIDLAGADEATLRAALEEIESRTETLRRNGWPAQRALLAEARLLLALGDYEAAAERLDAAEREGASRFSSYHDMRRYLEAFSGH